MVTRNAFLLTRHKRARHEAKTTTPEVSTCNHCNKKFASAALCKEHMSQCQAPQVDVFSFLTFSCVFKALLMSYAFVPQFFLAGGELHKLCRGLQLSIGVFQPIKRQTPQCKLGRSNGDLLLGSDLICLRPLQEGFCKRKEPCQTYGEVPQWVSFFCKQT